MDSKDMMDISGFETLVFVTDPPQEGGPDADAVAEWLKMLTGCGRFDFNVMFLEPEKIKMVGTLLEGVGEGDGEIDALKKKYGL